MIIDAEVLRVILIIAGVIIILLIYFWERLRRDDVGEIGWQESRIETLDKVIMQDTNYSMSNEVDTSTKNSSQAVGENNQIHSKKLEQEIPIPIKSKDRCKCEDENDYWQAGPPQLVLQLNISAKSEAFSGVKILKALEEAGFKANERGIFNYHSKDEADILFSIVSMVKPGTIPVQELDEFKTPGLTLFSDLSGFENGIALFSMMLFKAKTIAAELGGELQDDSRSRLTNQTIEHIHSQIIEYQRQIQLAFRRCNK